MYALASQSSAPWWGAPLIAAIALLVGSGLTLLVTHRRAVDEQKLTDKRRWDDLILDTCVEIERVCNELVGLNKHGWRHYIADERLRMDRYVELVDELNAVRGRFRFVASGKLEDSSLQVFEAALNSFVGSHKIGSDMDFETARAIFVTTARQELRAN